MDQRFVPRIGPLLAVKTDDHVHDLLLARTVRTIFTRVVLRSLVRRATVEAIKEYAKNRFLAQMPLDLSLFGCCPYRDETVT